MSHQFQNAFSSGNSEISTTFSLLPPGQKAEFRVVDMVDCAGTVTVKLPKQITIKGGFHGSHEQSIMLLGSRVSQQYLEFLENR